jgi:hypothetical protein
MGRYLFRIMKFKVQPLRLKDGTAKGRGELGWRTQYTAVCWVEILLLLQLGGMELRYEMCRAIVYIGYWGLCLCLCRNDGE